MMRTLALLALAALCGCGSGGTDPIVRAAMDEFGGIWGRRGEQPAGAPARPITRADITAADVAAIWARLESDPSPTLMYALAQNGPYVTYMSPLRQSITLNSTQITATRGLGTDLLSAWSSRPDPLAQAIPPGSWPASVERGYEFPGDGPLGELHTFRCTFERGGLTEMTILQVRHQGVEISETCTGPSGTFENLHFADARTGFVWRSLQWVGPSMDLVDLQVLEPYTGG
jgi:Group 4 capsule polysaccharide lipoprotein gfcB, YjbF